MYSSFPLVADSELEFLAWSISTWVIMQSPINSQCNLLPNRFQHHPQSIFFVCGVFPWFFVVPVFMQFWRCAKQNEVYTCSFIGTGANANRSTYMYYGEASHQRDRQVVYTAYTPPRRSVYICWAQSMDLCNLWIALCEAWIRALRDDSWIVRSIRGLRNSLCAKYRLASDPWLSPRLLWIYIAFITVIASIIK